MALLRIAHTTGLPWKDPVTTWEASPAGPLAKQAVRALAVITSLPRQNPVTRGQVSPAANHALKTLAVITGPSREDISVARGRCSLARPLTNQALKALAEAPPRRLPAIKASNSIILCAACWTTPNVRLRHYLLSELYNRALRPKIV